MSTVSEEFRDAVVKRAGNHRDQSQHGIVEVVSEETP